MDTNLVNLIGLIATVIGAVAAVVAVILFWLYRPRNKYFGRLEVDIEAGDSQGMFFVLVS